MKDYFCFADHYFNEEDVKEKIDGRAICPNCWPNGFLNKSPDAIRMYNSKVRITSREKGLPANYNEEFDQPM